MEPLSFAPVQVAKIIPIEFCHFLTHALLRYWDIAPGGDSQMPNAKTVLDHEYMFETLQERLWPVMEQIVGKPLIPTYSYARLYSNGDVLTKHKDRPACEVSITIQLGRSHHYAWPIFMEGTRFDLGEGDGVIYPGCAAEHWRDVCDGPEGYYSGQAFMHFVHRDGPYAAEAGDATVRNNYTYAKNRTVMMERK